MNHSVQVSSLEGSLAATSLQQSTIHYVRQRQRELIFFLLAIMTKDGPLGLLLVKSKVDHDCLERVGLVLDSSQVRTRVWGGGVRDSD